MGLVVYNTLSKTKEPFKTIEEGKVRMYVCGPTVYDYLHIGNFRGAIFFNLVRNWLEENGYKVTFSEITGWWKDTGKPYDLLEANRLILDNIHQFLLLFFPFSSLQLYLL